MWTVIWLRSRTRSALGCWIGWWSEAIARFMPETAEETRRRAADGRHFDVDHDQVSFAGTSLIHGEVDLADALDLDQAVADRAGDLKDLGCEESWDVRRAMAIGELARRQLALDLTARDRDAHDEPTTHSAGRKPRRAVVLYVHLHQSAIEGAGSAVGRVENTRSLVTAEQIRAWCGHPDAQVVVKPVMDLADHVHVEAYEVPDRIAEAVALRDLTCVFPWCTRPARRLPPRGASLRLRPRRPAQGGRGPTCTCATSRPCADDITGSRPTAAGPTPCSNPAPTSGRQPAPLPVPPRPHRHPRRHR